jgi:hypothetical protein
MNKKEFTNVQELHINLEMCQAYTVRICELNFKTRVNSDIRVGLILISNLIISFF